MKHLIGRKSSSLHLPKICLTFQSRNKSIMEAEAEAEAVALKGDAEAYAIEIKAKAEVGFGK